MPRHRVLLISLALGVLLGAVLHPFGDQAWLNALNSNLLQPVGQIFLRLIFMVVVPLVFSALVLGVYELGQAHGLGRIAGKTLGYTVIASSASVLIGIGLVNWIQPGRSFPLDREIVNASLGEVEKIKSTAAAQQQGFGDAIVALVPKNPLLSATQALTGEMLQLMVFALIFGFALSRVTKGSERGSSTLIPLLEQVFAVSMKIVDFAMKLAPVGVFAIVFQTVFKHGTGILGSLAMYVGVAVAGLLAQQLVTYSLLLRFGANRSPLEFVKNCREVLLYAFSTASSNATLPLSIETAETKLKIPPRIARFVLTVGATANQNGTALFEGVTVLFLAQVYGVDLSFAQQAQVVLMAILAGIGTAGIPAASLPMIMILLQTVGVPPEGIGLILGADRFLDMCRSAINVSGDLVIAAVVSRGEKK